jgi:hypothetical protein
MATWLPWLVQNYNHHWLRGPVYSGWNAVLAGMQVREQGGFGIIDAAVFARPVAGGPVEWLQWMTWNPDLDWERPRFIVPTAPQCLVGLDVKEEGGFGIVDARCLFRRGPAIPGLRRGPWFCGNPNGKVYRSTCPLNSIIVGIQVREQAGFGITDVRLAHV